jgi:hypothetical protein
MKINILRIFLLINFLAFGFQLHGHICNFNTKSETSILTNFTDEDDSKTDKEDKTEQQNEKYNSLASSYILPISFYKYNMLSQTYNLYPENLHCIPFSEVFFAPPDFLA